MSSLGFSPIGSALSVVRQVEFGADDSLEKSELLPCARALWHVIKDSDYVSTRVGFPGDLS